MFCLVILLMVRSNSGEWKHLGFIIELGGGLKYFSKVVSTPLEHAPKPLPTGYKGIPFIIG